MQIIRAAALIVFSRVRPSTATATYVVDIPYGRILRMSPTGEFGRPIRRMAQWTCDTPGWPRLHRRLSPRHHGVRSEDRPSPNGIALDPADNVLFVAMTRSNCMWHCPLKRGGGIAKVGVFAQLPGIHGPDGLAMDEAGNLSAAHARPGIVWLFSPIGEPLYRVQLTGKTARMTNMAYGSPQRKTLFITESYSGAILSANMPVAGKRLYSHL
jgi:gluconolactonase